MTTPIIGEFHNLPLVLHPSCLASPIASLSASGALSATGRLALVYELQGDLRALRLAPAARRAQRRDELWRQTCLELFAHSRTGTAYLEFNFSPAGDWAAYEFQSYRAGRSDYPTPDPKVAVQVAGEDRLSIHAQVTLAAAFMPGQLGLAAVIEALDGSLSFWAVEHSGARPDFHERASCRVPLLRPRPSGSASASLATGGR